MSDTTLVLYSRKQTAEILGVTPRAIIKWEKAEKLTPVGYVGIHPRYHIDDIAKLLTVKQKPAHV